MQLTTRNATLADLAVLLRDQHARKLDVVVGANKIRAASGRLIIPGIEQIPDPDRGMIEVPGTFTPTSVCDEGIADKLSIPLAYVRRMRETRVDLYDDNVNGWLHGDSDPDGPGPDDRNFLVRCFRGDDLDSGVARAFLSDGFGIIDHLDVLTAAMEGIRDSGVEVAVTGCDLTDRRMYVRVAAPAVHVFARDLLAGYRSPFNDPQIDAQRRHGREDEVRQIFRLAAQEGQGYEPGAEPVCFAGFEISNSETGGGALQIVGRIVVQICGNGYKITRDALRRVHLGGKMEEGQVKWSTATREKNLELIASQAKDAVRMFLDKEWVEARVDELTETAETPVTDAADTLEVIGKELSFGPERTAAILDHFIRGGQMTAGGVLNAVTSYSQTIPDGDVAADVEGKAVRAMELAAAVR